MSRITTPAIASATGAAAEVFARFNTNSGGVPNTYAVIGTLNPAALKAILDAEAVLAKGNLNAKDQETIKLAVSEATGCNYCAASHVALGLKVGLNLATLEKIRTGEPTGDAKRDALLGLVRRLTKTSGTISEDEFSAIKAAGYSNEQLVDISLAVSLITFTNVFNRVNDTDLDSPLK
jgi:uncharacterized peroxidase-related enzyme